MQSFKLAIAHSKYYSLHMPEIAAVLTGDLISSTSASPEAVDAAMNAIADAAKKIGEMARRETHFTRYRGDGWQLYLHRPHLILKAALLLSARLRAADTGLSTRISIGLGRISYLGKTDLSDARGDAFTLSGRALDTMWKSKRIALEGAGASGKWQAAIFHLTDWQASRWTKEQAEVVALTLETVDPTQSKLAEKLGISRQAVQARLNGSGFAAIEWALYAFESHNYYGATP
jgi:hypothetical protein